MSFTAAWVAGVVFVLRLLLKNRAPKRVLCLLWLVVFARLLVPVKLESPVSLVPPVLSEQSRAEVSAPVSPAVHQGGTVFQSAAPVQTAAPAGTASPLPVATAPALPENTPAPAVPEVSAFPWRALLAGTWLAGTVGMLGCGLVSYVRLRRRVRFAVRVADRVWEDEAVASPFILGLFRPRVYLPSGLEGQARQYILCHEFAHLRRLDHIVKPLCWFALAIHWFNPAAWAAFLLLGRDMEGACDEAVLRSLGENVKAGYSYTLLALASGKHIPAPCPLAFDEGDAKGRIKNVLSYRRPALWIVVVSVLAVIVAAVCLLTDPVAEKPDDTGPDSSPTPTESGPGPSQAPDESLNSVLDPWMLEVLNGERTFSIYDTDRDIDHLAEAFYGEDPPENLGLWFKLALLDLDRDGANELVLWPMGENDDTVVYQTGYVILRQEGDTVRGYTPGWRTMGNLKADGTFHWSGSASEHGTGTMSFNGMDNPTESFTFCNMDSGTAFYVVDNRSATQEEFDAAIAAQDAKPEPVWYVFQDGELVPVDGEAWKDLVGVGCKPYVPIPVDPAVNVSVPSFLDMDQKWLYQEAYTLYSHIFGANTEEVDTWASPVTLPPAEPVERNGTIYESVNGLFANWEDFEAAALSVFTPAFWEARNTYQVDEDGTPHHIYINVDGRTYYIAAARGSGGLNDNFPDTFHLPTQTETEISFVLMGHYSEGHLLEGESPEERDARLAANWEEYIGYPMKLVLTENGWRFDGFHVTATDNALLPYANQAAPNPALYPDNPEPAGGACVHGLDHVYVDHLIDGRLVYRCQEDFFPYYPPYPGAYSSESIAEGDYDGDGHIEEIVRNSAGTLMLCDIVPQDGQPVYGGKYGEMKTCTFDPHTLGDGYPNADFSTAWIEPGDELIYCVPLRPEPSEAATGTVEFHLRYDGTALIHGGPAVVTTQG